MDYDGIHAEVFIPSTLMAPWLYDPTIELLYEDEDATEKRAAVREEATR